MNGKAPLAMIEQLIMLLFFALAAAICLQAFVWSGTAARNSRARDDALAAAQSAAELARYYHGDLEQAAAHLGGTVENGVWKLSVSGDEAPGGGAYTVTVTPAESGSALLGLAEVTAEGTDICLTAAWQEGGGHG